MQTPYKLPSLSQKKQQHCLFLSSSVEIPENSSEILLSSLQSIDLKRMVNTDMKRKILESETNDFRFYDIPVFLPSKEKPKVKREHENFKSIHNNADLLQAKSFTSKIFLKPNYEDLQKKARISLKRSGSLLMLNEIFFELDKAKGDLQEKAVKENKIYCLTETDHEKESNTVSNLDDWIKKALKYQELRHQKGYFPNIHKETQESELEKKELLEEEILKKYNNEEYRNLKIKVRRKEDYEIQNFLKKMPKINKISTVLFLTQQKKTEETNEIFLLNVKKNIKTLMRSDFTKSTILEMADFLEKHVDMILENINQKIKNWEALLVTKEQTMQLIRKENIHILDRIHKIREIKVALQKAYENQTSMSPEFRKSRMNKKDFENLFRKGEKPEEQIRKQMAEFVIMKDKEEKKKQNTELSQNLSAFQQKLDYNNKMIQELEPSKKAIKDDLKHLRKIHRKFLLKLLKSGKDFSQMNYVYKKAQHQENISEYELFSKISVEILKANVIDSGDKNSIIKEVDEVKEDSVLMTKNKPEMSVGSVFITKPPKDRASLLEEANDDIMETSKIILGNDITIFNDKIKEMVYRRFKNSVDPMTKFSISDVVYEETRKKIKELIRPNYEPESKEKTHFEELSTLTFDVDYSEKFTQNVLLFENNSRHHYHTNRADFLKDVETLNKKIVETQKIIQKQEINEIHRIVKEFDYKNYAKRFCVDVATVLSSLVGVKQALKEISKFGMTVERS